MCIRDRPSFYEIQKRSIMTNVFKINLLSKQYPASFIPFDILYYKNNDISLLPLMERKEYLSKAVGDETARMALSKYIEGQGMASVSYTHLYLFHLSGEPPVCCF